MLKNNLLIFAENVVFPKGELREGPFYVVIKRGLIVKISKAESAVSSVTQCERCDAVTCHTLTPGFVDIHNYGLGAEKDVLDNWKKPDYTCAKSVATGTTSLLATIVFPEEKRGDELSSVLKILEKRVGKKGLGAVIEGVNAEGPLISDFGDLLINSKEIGVKDFENLLDEIPGLKIMSVSPHVAAKKNYQPIKMLHERGVIPSLDHDLQADEQEIIDALSKSPSQPCHISDVFKFNHRNPGLVNFGLLNQYPSISKYESAVPPTVELIGDMIHSHPLAVQLCLNSRSWDHIAFVTDTIAAKQSKNTINSGDRKPCTMLDIFKSLITDFQVPVGKAIMMLSENPARIAKLDNVGTVDVGKDANLLMFDPSNNLMKTFVDGRLSFRTSSCRKKSVVSTESFDES